MADDEKQREARRMCTFPLCPAGVIHPDPFPHYAGTDCGCEGRR